MQQRAIRLVLVGAPVALLMGVASYLYVVRGPAILIDLAAAGRAFFCF